MAYQEPVPLEASFKLKEQFDLLMHAEAARRLFRFCRYQLIRFWPTKSLAFMTTSLGTAALFFFIVPGLDFLCLPITVLPLITTVLVAAWALLIFFIRRVIICLESHQTRFIPRRVT
ncbi:unnamed protein product, partial [Protopolystoma xenopodis]